MEELELLGDAGVAGARHEAIEEVTLEGTEVAKGKLGLGSLGAHIVAANLDGGGASLLVDPLDDGILGAATSVVLLGSLAVANQENVSKFVQ